MAFGNDRVAQIIGRLATIVALLVAASLPVGYFLVAYSDISDSLAFKAKVKATALSNLIASVPDVWMFAENRIQGLISREPVPLADEQVKIFDVANDLVLETGQVPRWPQIARSEPLYDAGRVVGSIEVIGTLRELVFRAIGAGVLGMLLGLLVFVVMRTLPLRALQRVMDALFDEKARAEITLNSISDAVITTDAQGHVHYLNPMAEQLLDVTIAQALGKPLDHTVHLIDGTTRKPIDSSLLKALQDGRIVSCSGNSELFRSDGRRIAVEERSAPIFDQTGKTTGGVLVLRDVSTSREFLQRRSWEATHDPLTRLCNRREFESRIQSALADTQESGRDYLACYLDLDRFKVVNDSCSHAAGDELLTQVAQLMLAQIRDTDTLARLGGDEFGLLLEGCELSRGQLIAESILAAINEYHFSWEAKVFTVGVSVGMTQISADHSNAAEVISEADSACYLAKEQGRNRVCVYRASNLDLAARRSETGWVGRIQAAFNDNRFVLYHQQYRSLNPGAGTREHIEILIRMIGENGELVAPGRFLPAAERFNLMPDIDRWVIQTLFRQYHTLVAQRGGVPLTCAINLSGSSINSEGFLDLIKSEAHEHRLGAGSICFELTETVAVNNLQIAAEFIRECKALGFLFALDDFGAGTSSFGYLKTLPVDFLKIDGGFVRDIEHDKVDQAMTETINKIGHIMGMQTIAEYAENEASIKILQEIGVDFAQGYGVSEPKPLL